MEAACTGRRIVLIPKASRASTAPRLRGFSSINRDASDSHLRMTPARRWRKLPACVADLVSTMPAARVSGCRGIPSRATHTSPPSHRVRGRAPHGADADSSTASGSSHPVRAMAILLLKGVRHVPASLVRPLGLIYAGKHLPPVLHSAAGHYIGTRDIEGPVSRESVEYFRSSAAAQRALDRGGWTQLPTLDPHP